MPAQQRSRAGTERLRALPVLDRRALNRATLHRQGLLERWRIPAAEAVHRLFGLQSQLPDPPYFSLWTRVDGFTQPDLTRLIEDRTVVRSGLMRATLHVVTAADFLWLRPLLQPVRERAQRTYYGRQLAGVDIEELKRVGRELLDERPLNNLELREALGARWPGHDRTALMHTVRYLLPLVHVPPAGIWGSHGSVPCTTDVAWLGRPICTDARPEEMVLRYLAAYGPATVKDVQAWSGLTRLAEVVERLRPRLRTFADEHGRELFDLPDAPLPDPDTPAAVRFLPEFDNLLMAHADRTRVISDEHREITHTKNGLVAPTILVDGAVRGQWRIERGQGSAALVIQPFAPITPAERQELEEEGLRLLAFAAGGRAHTVTFK